MFESSSEEMRSPSVQEPGGLIQSDPHIISVEWLKTVEKYFKETQSTQSLARPQNQDKDLSSEFDTLLMSYLEMY